MNTLRNTFSVWFATQPALKTLVLALTFCSLQTETSTAQTTFSNPVYYFGYSASHFGNPGAVSKDMDGDGDLDIVFVNRDFDLSTGSLDALVLVRVNDGLGGFGSELKIVLPYTFSPSDFAVDDLNNDGLPDIITVAGGNISGTGFLVMLNTSNGGNMSFASPVSYAPARNAGVSVADINADGNKDIIINQKNVPTAEFRIFFGDGTGANWTEDANINATHSNFNYSLIADFNGDALLDIMGIDETRGQMFYFQGNALPGGGPDGTFQSDVAFSISGFVEVAIVADLNEDGLADIAFADNNNEGVGILLNNNDGNGASFTKSFVAASASNRIALSVNDIDGDDNLDLMAPVQSPSDARSIFVFNGNGDGTFQSGTTYTYGNPNDDGELRGTTGDYNGDGLVDMASIDAGLWVYLNIDKSELALDQGGTAINSNGTYDFGYRSMGSNSGVISFTLSNNGTIDATLTGTPKLQISGSHTAVFTIDESSTSAVIASGGSTTFTVQYTPSPSFEGVNTAVLTIPSNDPLTPYILNLKGTTQLEPDQVNIGTSTICEGQSTTITQSNGIIGAGEQWVWYSGNCGNTQVGTGESITVSPTVTTDYFVRAETTAGVPLTGCASGRVTVSGEVITVTAPTSNYKTLEGENQTLTVNVTGSNPSFQWQKNGVDLSDGGRISGTQTNALTITSLVEADQDVYTCVVTNTCNQESASMNLTVLQLPPNDGCGTVLDFDGSNDYVNLGGIYGPLNNITIEAWFYINSHFFDSPIISRTAQQFSRESAYTVVVSSNRASFEINTFNGTRDLDVSVSIETHRWYHIACTYNGSQMRLYLDGILLGTQNHSGQLRDDNDLVIASYPFRSINGHDTHGKIDEIRIWDVARSQSDISTNMTNRLVGSESNLIGYWDFDEGVGSTTITDKSGGGYTGTLVNMNPATDWLTLDGEVDDDAVTISVTECQEYTSPSGNFTWTTSGTYQETLQTPMGCDSVVTVNLTIEKFDQNITFNSLSDMTYGDADLTLAATADSGLPITYASSDPNVATVSGNTLTVTGGGTTMITASQAGDGCYNAATDVVQALNVSKTLLIATADDKTRAYGDANPALTIAYSGFVNGEDASFIDTPPTINSMADANNNAGDYAITLTGGLDNGYDFNLVDGTLTVNKRSLTIVGGACSQPYGDPGTNCELIYFGFTNGDDTSDLDVLPTQSHSVGPATPVGQSANNPVVLSGGSDNNYSYVLFDGGFEVTPAPLTIQANNQAKMVGNPNPTLTISYSGFVNGEGESVLTSLPSISTTANASSPTGTYAINVAGAVADNYNITHVDGTLTVTNNTPLIVKADNLNKAYGDADPVLTYQITSGMLMAGDNITGTPVRVPGEQAGTYSINQGTLTAGGNYTIIFEAGDLAINKRSLTITADDKIKRTGTTNPTFTVSYDGFVNGEGASVLTNPPSLSTEADFSSPPGTYTINVSGASADNYVLTYTSGTLDVFEIVPNTSCGNILNFDGVDDHVNLGDVLDPNHITLEAWVKTNSLGVRQGIVGKPFHSASEPYYQYHLEIRDDGDLYFALSINGSRRTIRTTNSLVANTWYHVAATFDGSVMKVYVDGVEWGSNAVSGNISDYATSLNIGASSGLELNGQLDEMRIWDIGRTQTQILDNKDIQLEGNEANLIGYWNFDQGAGSTALVDKTNNSNDGALTNMDPSVDWTLPNGSVGGNSSSTIVANDCQSYTSPSGNFTWNTSGVYQDIIPNQNGCDSLITVNLTIEGLDQAIDFQPLSNKTYLDGNFALSATSDSGLPVTFTSSDPGVATISGSTVTIVGAGTTTITASQTGNSCYNSATAVPQNLTVDPAAITITTDTGQSKVYGQSDPVLTYSITSGSLGSGDNLTGSLSRAIGENVGTYTISQGTLTAGNNYSVTFIPEVLEIKPKAITITANAAQTKIYGDSDPTLTFTLTSGTLETGDNLTGALDRVAGESVGMYAISQGTMTAGGNYTISFVTENFEITPRPVTVTAGAGQSKIYGASDPVLAHAITTGSLVAGDSFNGTLTRASGEDVGAYVISQGTLTAGGNYNLTFVSDNFNIVQKSLTVTASPSQTKAYGSNDPVLTYSLTSGSLEAGDALSGVLDRIAGEQVGTYAIEQGTLTAGGNYSIVFVSDDFEIIPKALTITADASQTKVYGQADPVLTYALTSGNLEVGDSFTGGLNRIGGENIGLYALSLGSLTAGGNYQITFVSDNFRIAPKAITVTANTAQSKVYGDSDPVLAFTLTVGDLEAGDGFIGNLDRTSGENAGMYAIDQGTLTAGSNYTINFISNNFEIAPKQLTVTTSAGQSKVYGDSDPALTYSITAGSLVGGDTFSGTLTRAVGEDVGTYVIGQGTLTAGGNYNLVFISDNFSITPKSVTLTADPLQTKIYGSPDPIFTYGLTSGNLETGDAFTGALDRTSGEDVGTYAIGQGTLTAGSNYNIVFVADNFEISKKAITIGADALQNKVYGETDPVLTYTLTSGSLEFGDGINGSLDRVQGESVGLYAIGQGTLTAGGNYAITFDADNFEITRKPITVTATAGQGKVYGATDPTLAYSLTSGTLEAGDGLTGTLDRTAGENTGLYPIGQGSVSAGANYNLTFVSSNFEVTQRPLTITANPNQSKTYGTTDPTLTYTVTNGTLIAGDAINGSPARASGENIGNYTITQGSVDGGANYDLTFVSDNFQITTRALTITSNGVSKVYGDTDPALTYHVTSGALVGGDAITGALSRVAGEGVGRYAINSGTLTAGANYILTFISGDLLIGPRALTVTADNKSKVYGDSDPIFTYQIASGALQFSDQVIGTLSRATGEGVGTYAILQGTVTAGSNYTLSYISSDLTVSPRPLEVKADAKSKVYGDTDPTLTYSITSGSLQFSDIIAGALTRVAGEQVGTYIISQGTITAGNNYSLTYVPDNLTISPRTLEITAEAKSKIYGDSDPLLTYQVTSGALQFSDAFSGSLSRTSGEDLGAYPILQGTVSAGNNYILNFVGDHLTISSRPVEITADAKSKVYGDSDPVLTYQLTAGALQFSDVFTGSLTRMSGEDAGNYPITQGTVTAGSNYTVSYVSNNLTIGLRALEITANAQNKVYGDTDPTLTYQVTSGALQSSDVVTGTLSRASGESVGTYSINQGTLSAGSNYTLSYVSNDVTISPRSIQIMADAQNKVYGNTDPNLTFQLTSGNLVNGDALTGALVRVSGEDTGAYTIGIGSVDAGSNYTLNYIPENLTIVPRPIEVTADARNKTYGDADPALTFTISSGSLVNNDSFTGALTRVAGEDVGTYTISLGTLSAGNNYVASYVADQLTIGARAIQITADHSTKTYGASDPVFTYRVTSGSLISGDQITGTLSRIAGENVGTYPIHRGTVSTTNNYLVSYVSNDLTINPATLSIVADDKTRMFGQSNPALTVTYTGFVNSEDVSVITTPVISTTANSASNVGAYPITLSGGHGQNYTIVTTNGVLTVTKANQTINFGALNDVTVGGTSFNLTAAASSGLPVSYTSSNPTVATVSGNTVTIVGTGTTNITAQQTGNTNFNAAPSVVQSLTVNTKLSQSITFNALPRRTYGDENITLTASGGGSGNPVTFSSSDPTVATLSGDVLTIVGAGSTDIAASQLGDANYNPASSVVRTLVVEKAVLSVSADDKSKIYGASNPTFTINYSGFVNGDNEQAITPPVVTTSTTLGSDAGTYAITLSGGSSSNYTFTLNNGTFTIQKALLTVTVSDGTRVYGAPNPVPAISYSGFVLGEDASVIDVSPVVSTSADLNSDVGNYALILTGGSDNNYNLDLHPGTLTVQKAVLQATADDHQRPYDSDNPQFTTSYSGFVNGQNSSVIDLAPALTTTATRLSPVGSYPIDISGGLDNNYDFVYNNGSLTIQKANQTITFEPLPTVAFGDRPVVLTASVPSGLVIKYTSSNSSVAVIDGQTIKILGPGTTLITASQSGDDNYNSAPDVVQTLTVTKAAQSITFVNPGTKTFGDPDFILNGTSTSGLPLTYASSNPNIVTILGDVATITGAGNVVITAVQLGDVNYESAADVSQNLTVQRADQTITFDPIADVDIAVTTMVSLSAFTSSGLEVDFQVLSGNGAVSGSDLTITGLGTITVGASQSGNVNYQPAVDVTQSFVVTDSRRQDQTISFLELGPRTFGDEPFDIEATSSSGLEVTFVSADQDVATIMGNTVTIVGAGTTTITAMQSGDDAFNPAASVGRALTIEKAEQTIDFEVLTNRAFGDPSFTLMASSTSGLPVTFSSSDPNVLSVSNGIATILGAGSTVVTASQSGNNNYLPGADVSRNLTIDKAPQTITFTTIGNKTIQDSPITLQASTNSGMAVTFSLLQGDGVISGSLLTINNDGQFVVEANQSGDINYDAAVPVQQSFLVTDPSKQSQTISFEPISNKVYGDTFILDAMTSSGLEVNFTIIQGPAVLSGAEVSIVGIGEIVIAADQMGDATFTSAATVTRAFEAKEATLIVQAEDKSRVYGQPNPALTLTYDGFRNGDDASVLTSVPSISTAATLTSNVGLYDIVLQGGDAEHYLFDLRAGTLTVSKEVLRVTADDQTMLQGGTVPELTMSFTNFANGEDISVVDILPTITTTATTESVPGFYPIELTGGADNNYILNLNDGLLTVEAVTSIEQELLETMRVYPIPFNSTLTIDFPLQSAGKEYVVMVYNLTGTLIFETQVTSNGSSYTIQELKGEPEGIYMINLSDEKASRTLLVIKDE